VTLYRYNSRWSSLIFFFLPFVLMGRFVCVVQWVGSPRGASTWVHLSPFFFNPPSSCFLTPSACECLCVGALSRSISFYISIHILPLVFLSFFLDVCCCCSLSLCFHSHPSFFVSLSASGGWLVRMVFGLAVFLLLPSFRRVENDFVFVSNSRQPRTTMKAFSLLLLSLSVHVGSMCACVCACVL
jgi:hypothetical protein